MSRIAQISAREILDSRGRPTLEVDVHCDDGSTGCARVPSGASCGRWEAFELRDGDPDRYDGLGVLRAVQHIEATVAPELVGHDPGDQWGVDQRLCEFDDTPRKTQLGGNTLLGVSLAVAHAGATAAGVPLYRHLSHLLRDLPSSAPSNPFADVRPRVPRAMTNMISGGLHAGGNLDYQDFMIIPHGAPDFASGLEWTVRVYRRLGTLLLAEGYSPRLVGDEGGYGPALANQQCAAELVSEAIEAAGLNLGSEVAIAIDVAATHFFDGTHYCLSQNGHRRLTRDEQLDQLAELTQQFPIISVEDGLAEDDWVGWQQLTRRLGDRVQIVGDDLITTNHDRLQKAISTRAANAVLVKMNQIGTLCETLRVIQTARVAGWKIIVSARSGETEDTTMADLAVAAAADYVKIGGITRSERLVKYNRLLGIERELRSV